MVEQKLTQSPAFAYFRQQVQKKSGYHLAPSPFLEDRLRLYLRLQGCDDLEQANQRLKTGDLDVQAFLDSLLINESEFFRNPDRFKELKKRILPRFFTGCGQVRIWSAGCSFGAEAYSLMILIANLKRLHQARLYATDLDRQALIQAQTAVFSKNVIKNVSKSDLSYYFELQTGVAHGVKYALKPRWHQQIDFAYHDLLRDPYPESYHLIVCRNVMIYFDKASKYQVYQKFWRSLKPGGVLFIGGAEQLLDIHSLGFESLSPYFLLKPES